MIVAVALSVSVAVFVTSRRRDVVPKSAPVARLDPAAVVESSGALVRDVKGARERFRVEAGRQLTYSGGRSKLMDVRITVERSGKTFVLTGSEAEVGENQSSVSLNGHVHLAGSDGLIVDASSATYNDSEGIVRAPGPVTFSRGSMTGKGVDFSYDRSRDSIALADQTIVKIAPDKKDKAGADIKAGSAILARKDGFMSFERAVHIIRGDQVIDSERAVADLTDDEKHVSALDLNGSATVTKPAATAGSVRSMTASNIKLTYAEDSELLQHAMLHGIGTTDGWSTALTGAVQKVLQQAEKVKGKWEARKRGSAGPRTGANPRIARTSRRSK